MLPDLSRKPDVAFRVRGLAKTKGSVKAFVPCKPWANPPRDKGGRIIVSVMNMAGEEAKKWEQQVALVAKAAMVRSGVQRAPKGTAVVVQWTFYMPRPQGHYGTGRNAGVLKPRAPLYPVTAADVDKMVRCAQDALTGVVYDDDRQVIGGAPWKFYAEEPGRERLDVRVWILDRASPPISMAENR